jgi:hypothetical protein
LKELGEALSHPSADARKQKLETHSMYPMN